MTTSFYYLEKYKKLKKSHFLVFFDHLNSLNTNKTINTSPLLQCLLFGSYFRCTQKMKKFYRFIFEILPITTCANFFKSLGSGDEAQKFLCNLNYFWQRKTCFHTHIIDCPALKQEQIILVSRKAKLILLGLNLS